MTLKKIAPLCLLVLASLAGWRISQLNGPEYRPAASLEKESADNPELSDTGIVAIDLNDARMPLESVGSPIQERAAAPAPEHRLVVLVRGPNGRPVDEVDVRLASEWDDPSGLSRADLPGIEYRERAEPAGPPGRFSAPADPDAFYRVTARSPGWATMEQVRCTTATTVEFELVREAKLRGVLLAASDKMPIKDATVRAFHGQDAERFEETLTDSNGAFQFEGLTPGEVSYMAAPRLHRGVRYNTLEIEAGETRVLLLEVEARPTLQGQITDAETGLPIETAEVALSPFFQPGYPVEQQGHYVLGLPRNGRGTVTVRAPGYAPSSMEFVGSPREELNGVDIQLSPELVLTGRVVDGAGDPAPGGYVGLRGYGADDSSYLVQERPAMTDQDGRFSAGGIRGDGYLVVSAGAKGCAPVPRVVRIDETAFQGGVAELEPFVLAPTASISGRVISETGKPVAGANLYGIKRYAPKSGEDLRTWERRHDMSAADGSFTLRGLTAGVWMVNISSKGNAMVDLEFDIAAGEDRTGVTWTVPEADTASLMGLVTGPDGLPLEKAFVSLRPSGPPAAGEPAPPRINGVGTDEGGRFEFGHVPEGEYVLHVSPPETDFREWKWNPPKPGDLFPARVEGVRADGRLVEVRLLDCSSSVAGRVIDGDGNGVPLAYVCIDLGLKQSRHGALTDDTGSFEFAVPAGQALQLHAWKTAPVGTRGGNKFALEVDLNRELTTPRSEPLGSTVAQPGSLDVRIQL